MNVLSLFDGYRRMDDRLRIINMYKKMGKICTFNIYGPNEHELNNELAPIKYNSNISLNDIIKEFNADVLLLDLYKPGCYNWIDKEFSNINIPSAIIEEDHYTVDGLYDFEKEVLKWYKDCKISLIVRRHYYEEEQDLNTVWWPFSANINEFFNNNYIRRKNLIFFAGSTGTPYYSIRRDAINKLLTAKLIEPYTRVNNYPLALRTFTGSLSCAGGELHTPMAKAFEIMASGTALLTNHMYNDKILFGDKKCYFEYKDDCSDIVEQANIILNDKDLVNEVINNAMEIFKERHTEECKIKELYNILKALVAGEDIPRIWGQ